MTLDPTLHQPSTIDLDHLRRWVGRVEEDEDPIDLRHAGLMAATLAREDLPQPSLQAGDPLPPLWHWLWFLAGRPAAELGPDGHPARGGFLPPVPLPNRMWAGGRVEFEAPIPLGATVRKRSQVLAVDHKRGRSGELVFVTVLHELWVGDTRCLREEHDIVYKSPSPPTGGNGSMGADTLPEAQHSRAWTPDSTQLFRYSALTFNGHRIHYDLDYCRQAEGYDNLVVHGPLQATLLAGYAAELAGRPLRRFSYRGLRPALLGATLTLNACRDCQGPGYTLWTALPGGAVSMQAQAVVVD